MLYCNYVCCDLTRTYGEATEQKSHHTVHMTFVFCFSDLPCMNDYFSSHEDDTNVHHPHHSSVSVPYTLCHQSNKKE